MVTPSDDPELDPRAMLALLRDARDRLNEAAEGLRTAQAYRRRQVRRARDTGLSYGQIGKALGIGDEAARQLDPGPANPGVKARTSPL